MRTLLSVPARVGPRPKFADKKMLVQLVSPGHVAIPILHDVLAHQEGAEASRETSWQYTSWGRSAPTSASVARGGPTTSPPPPCP